MPRNKWRYNPGCCARALCSRSPALAPRFTRFKGSEMYESEWNCLISSDCKILQWRETKGDDNQCGRGDRYTTTSGEMLPPKLLSPMYAARRALWPIFSWSELMLACPLPSSGAESSKRLPS